jgi:hypothetical protein
MTKDNNSIYYMPKQFELQGFLSGIHSFIPLAQNYRAKNAGMQEKARSFLSERAF